MVVLETQTFNFKAISFYKKHGFEIIGFDRYAYSNRGPEEHNMRLEMGKMLWASFVKCHIIWSFYTIYMTLHQGKSNFFLRKSYNFAILA